ncbi:unnamed protein product, partial [Mesorhabditis belari]|uniref:Synembryn n=1 Tax=Mesorhabditis belari TaxID=2138241 RepID=A0AAF3FF78_9BILA
MAEVSELTAVVVLKWRSMSNDELNDELARWNRNFSTRFAFSDISIDSRKEISSFFTELVDDRTSSEIRRKLLEMVRLLARDSNNLEYLLNERLCDFIFEQNGILEGHNAEEIELQSMIEAEKCLINLLRQSASARGFFEKKATNGLLKRLKEYTNGNGLQLNALSQLADKEVTNEIWFFDLRIAFITTAYLQSLQTMCRNDESFMNALIVTIEQEIHNSTSSETREFPRASEAMKVLYNVICRCGGKDFPESVDTTRLIELSCEIIGIEKIVGKELVQHSVNLLTALPQGTKMCSIACPQITSHYEGPHFDRRDMKIPDNLIKILAQQLAEVNPSERELLNTYFVILLMLCTECKEARRYCRLLVLPPLTAADVARRPDEGDTLRNKMIRAIHSTVSRDLAAEFLFLLCKRSVPRMIKYTGFGHAAGLFADRGLLGKVSERKEGDSEDSETEEYQNVSNDVNPVSGYIQQRGANPLEGMTEEQKEYEAMKLVNAIDQMMRSGGIRPASIGADGRPREVSHVLELCKDAPESREDSDDEN